MKQKTRELSVDFEKPKRGEKGKGFDFCVTSKEDPIKLKAWIIKELKNNNVKYTDIRISRPEEQFVTPVTRTVISNYIRKFRE